MRFAFRTGTGENRLVLPLFLIGYFAGMTLHNQSGQFKIGRIVYSEKGKSFSNGVRKQRLCSQLKFLLKLFILELL